MLTTRTARYQILGMFMSTMIEVSVDVGCSFVERRQGIKTELWYKSLSAAKLFSLTFFIGATILVNLWLMLCYDECHEQVKAHTEWERERGFFQYGKMGDFSWQDAPTAYPTAEPTLFTNESSAVANVTSILMNLTCPTLPKTAFAMDGTPPCDPRSSTCE